MTDDPDRRDDPRWDARAAEWVRIEPDGDGWCVVLYGTGPDGERAEDFFLVLHRHQQREDVGQSRWHLVDALGEKGAEPMTRTTKVHRIEVLVIDHDDLGADGVREVIENTRYPNRCIHPDVKRIDTREVEWSDEHPLNYRGTEDAAYRDLFGEEQSR